ncbi:unnamed protein product [Natator depressus]
MPFGLTNEHMTFQIFINGVLWDILDQYVVAYLDDVLIYLNNAEHRTMHIHSVLQRLCQYGLCANLEKCAFSQSSIEFVGFILFPAGIKMDPCKVKAALEWVAPRNFQELQSFLGFMPKFSEHITLLAALLCSNTELL